MARNSAYRSKGPIWAMWALSTVLTLTFTVLACVSLNSLQKVRRLDIGNTRLLIGPRLALTLSIVTVWGLNVVALGILLAKTWLTATGPNTFSYGFLDAAYLYNALILLLTSLMLWADRRIIDSLHDLAGALWTGFDSGIYTATYVFGFIGFGVYLFCFALLIAYSSELYPVELHPADDEEAARREPLLAGGENGVRAAVEAHAAAQRHQRAEEEAEHTMPPPPTGEVTLIDEQAPGIQGKWATPVPAGDAANGVKAAGAGPAAAPRGAELPATASPPHGAAEPPPAAASGPTSAHTAAIDTP